MDNRQLRDAVELDIRRTHKGELLSPFVEAICRYELIEEGDRIAVCISGGKDSMCMAKMFQELKRRNKVAFELVFIGMDPGYNTENRLLLERNAELLGIDLELFDTDIFDSVTHVEKSPCYLCAKMRRGWLYRAAKDRGCNKIALGHHFDDAIETTLMSMLYGGEVRTMMPKLRSTSNPGMELIRPLYRVREEAIEGWRDRHDLHFLKCACKFTEGIASGESDRDSKRAETKALIRELREKTPQVERNIFHAMEHVNLDTVLGYKRDGEQHLFTEEY